MVNSITTPMGSSGSDKSTLLNIPGILDKYDEGTYHLANTLLNPKYAIEFLLRL